MGWDTAFFSLSGTTAGQPFYQQQKQTVAEPFVAVRLGYSWDLPHGFFLGLRAEERLALARAYLQVQDPGKNYVVATRAWSFNSGALLGWRFY